MTQQIRTEIANRQIGRLCHFTLTANLRSIFSSGAVYSNTAAEAKGIYLERNDKRRLDGQPGHVSLSVQYPNTYVMQDFRDNAPPNHPLTFVVLDIDTDDVNFDGALFCPTNAARDNGAHSGEDLAHFQSLFQPTVPQNPKYPNRSAKHPKFCPTDLQAEVMIADHVPVGAIRRIFVEMQRDFEHVGELELPVDVVVWPILFQPTNLVQAIQNGDPPQRPRRP